MIIQIPQPEIPEWIEASALALNLKIKSEFHVTITSRAIDAAFPNIEEIVNKLTLSVRLLSLYWVAQKFYETNEQVAVSHTRRSLVQLVEVRNLDSLYNQLGLPTLAFPHVTLFVGCDVPDEPSGLNGIAIASIDDPGLEIDQIHRR